VLHACVELGAQLPWPVQVPFTQTQPEEQVSVSVPQLPHAAVRVSPGAHAAAPEAQVLG